MTTTTDRRLSEEHIAVLRLAAAGLSNAEIGQRLYLAENSVKRRLHRIAQLWGTGPVRRCQLVAAAIRKG